MCFQMPNVRKSTPAGCPDLNGLHPNNKQLIKATDPDTFPLIQLILSSLQRRYPKPGSGICSARIAHLLLAAFSGVLLQVVLTSQLLRRPGNYRKYFDLPISERAIKNCKTKPIWRQLASIKTQLQRKKETSTEPS